MRRIAENVVFLTKESPRGAALLPFRVPLAVTLKLKVFHVDFEGRAVPAL